jgi:superfamily II DNA or RNA helicase
MTAYSKNVIAWGAEEALKSKQPKTIRPYQAETQAHMGNWLHDRDACRSCAVVLATGMGKTWTTANFIAKEQAQHDTPVLWVAHRDSLLIQAQETLQAEGVSTDLVKAESHYLGGDNVVASVQSLKGDRLEQLSSQFDPKVIVMDEAHHGEADTWAAIKEAFPDAKIVNLTATPYHGSVDNPLDLGEIVACYSTQDAIDMGYLVPYERVILSVDDLRDLSVSKNTDYTREELSTVMRKNVGHCVKHTQQYMEGNKSLVFGTDLAHCHDLKAEYQQAGVKAEVVSGLESSDEKQALIQQLRQGKIDTLLSYNVLTEGTDIPEVNQVINFRPTPLAHSYVQWVGRGLRPLIGADGKVAMWEGHPLKPMCRVIDIPPIKDHKNEHAFVPLPDGIQLERARALNFDEAIGDVTVTDALWSALDRSFIKQDDLQAYWAEGTPIVHADGMANGANDHPTGNEAKNYALAHGFESLDGMVAARKIDGVGYYPQGIPSNEVSAGYWDLEVDAALNRHASSQRRCHAKWDEDPAKLDAWEELKHLGGEVKASGFTKDGFPFVESGGVKVILTGSKNDQGAPRFFIEEEGDYWEVKQKRKRVTGDQRQLYSYSKERVKRSSTVKAAIALPDEHTSATRLGLITAAGVYGVKQLGYSALTLGYACLMQMDRPKNALEFAQSVAPQMAPSIGLG